MIDLYMVNCKFHESYYWKIYNLISVERQEYVRRFVKYEDSLRSVLGEALARYAFAEQFGHNTDIEFTINEYGKPSIKGNDRFNYNISHSGNWVTCAVSSFDVGIDIEKVDSSVDIEIASKYFTDDEIQEIHRAEDKLSTFFHYWTAKESYLKFLGKGLTIPLDSFFIFGNSVIVNGISLGVRLHFFSKIVGYKIAVCGKYEEDIKEPVIVSKSKLISVLRK